MKEDYNPLVTIGVLTYNSAKYVLETLESAKAQTYKNIELIISDDCSTDKTVELCREWVEKNKDRFVRCEILTVEKNTGIPANCNRRLRASKGEWLKGIAGDDILAPDCIENFINFVKENPEAEWVASHVQSFRGQFREDALVSLYDASEYPIFEHDVSSLAQYRFLLKDFPFKIMGCIFKTKMLVECGGYDERFPGIEDWPLVLKLSKMGNICFYMSKVTSFYRLHDTSISNGRIAGKLFTDFYKKRFDFDRLYRLPELHWGIKMRYYYNYYLRCAFSFFGLNRSKIFYRCIFGIFRPISVLENLIKSK